MAEKLTRWVWRKEALASNLSDSAKVLLCALHENINDATGQAWPSVATLMKATGKSESAIHRAYREVRKKGWITTTERPGTTSMNKIALPDGVSLLAPPPIDRGANSGTGGGVISGTPGVSFLAPEPSLEPFTLNHRDTADADMVGKEEKKAECPLPVAGFDERHEWGAMWPQPRSIHERDSSRAWLTITNEAFSILGWKAGAGMGSDPRWQSISDMLKSESFEYRDALIERCLAGTLSIVDIANVLAFAGINPPTMTETKGGENGEKAA